MDVELCTDLLAVPWMRRIIDDVMRRYIRRLLMKKYRPGAKRGPGRRVARRGCKYYRPRRHVRGPQMHGG